MEEYDDRQLFTLYCFLYTSFPAKRVYCFFLPTSWLLEIGKLFNSHSLLHPAFLSVLLCTFAEEWYNLSDDRPILAGTGTAIVVFTLNQPSIA